MKIFVYEQLLTMADFVTFNSGQYCVILYPDEDGKLQFGKKVYDRCYLLKRAIFRFFFVLKLVGEKFFYFNPVKNLKMEFKMCTY